MSDLYVVCAFLKDGTIAYEAGRRHLHNRLCGCLTRHRRFAARMDRDEAERLVQHRHWLADQPTHKNTPLAQTVAYYGVYPAVRCHPPQV